LIDCDVAVLKWWHHGIRLVGKALAGVISRTEAYIFSSAAKARLSLCRPLYIGRSFSKLTMAAHTQCAYTQWAGQK